MDTERRPSALQALLKMFRLTNTPTINTVDDGNESDSDEPLDQVSELSTQSHIQTAYVKSHLPSAYVRRESLLTKAFATGITPIVTNSVPPLSHDMSRALSTASSQSVPSTAELTSDGELTNSPRSASPSPPPPNSRLAAPLADKQPDAPANNIVIAPVTNDDKPAVVAMGEAAVEKTLGRKRCIMFACADKPAEPPAKISPAVSPVARDPPAEVQPRKSRLTFVCPTRQDSADSNTSKPQQQSTTKRPSSPIPLATKPHQTVPISAPAEDLPIHKPVAKRPTVSQTFHEFGSSHDEPDSWVNEPTAPERPKLTLKDVMSKENAIRRIAEEAEEEAEEEEREQEELENELADDVDGEDDFAPSSDEESNGGNESDDEGGFADSDDEESDAGSEYRFWAPSTTTAATNIENLTHFSSRQRSRSSSLDSTPSQSSAQRTKIFQPRRASKPRAIRMRPGTPELPDSTDFVCGTLDEDRPLEAAYVACLEQKKRDKQVVIPQDIDPSFPTSDLEDEEEEEEEEAEESEPAWLRDQFGAMDDEERGRCQTTAMKSSPSHIKPRGTGAPMISTRRGTNRSPAPPRLRSPPPRRLFGGHSPAQKRSPPPNGRYRSPRSSPTNAKMLPLGITINRLAQRPGTDQAASLPHTPNPFFRNWKRGSPVTSCIPSGAISPDADEVVRPDLHVRGPVDIVIGLEKKRQKRKERYWRQHCRKAAKEQAERKTVPGRGVERMKELGLECAERTRGYGLGQQAKLVLSL